MKITKEFLKKAFCFLLKLMNALAKTFGACTTDKRP